MAQIVDTSKFYPGLKIKWQNGLWEVVDCQHHMKGRGGAVMKCKLRNLDNGSNVEKSFTSGERFERIVFEEKPAQFIFKDGSNYVFMDLESFDQIPLTEEVLGPAMNYLTDNLEVHLDVFEGRIMGIELPTSVTLQIVDTAPSFKGDTVSGGGKPATLETGLTVTVPMFVENGEVIVVDTRTGQYLERAK